MPKYGKKILSFLVIIIALILLLFYFSKNSEEEPAASNKSILFHVDSKSGITDVDILKTYDGYFVIIDVEKNEDNNQVWVLRIGMNGNLKWKRKLPINYYFTAISKYGDLILVGDDFSIFNPAIQNNKLVIIDDKGNIKIHQLNTSYSNDRLSLYKNKVFQISPDEYLVFFSYIHRDGTEYLCPYKFIFFKDLYPSEMQMYENRIERFSGKEYLYTLVISNLSECYKEKKPLFAEYKDNSLILYLEENIYSEDYGNSSLNILYTSLENGNQSGKKLYSIKHIPFSSLEVMDKDKNLYIFSQEDNLSSVILLKKFNSTGELLFRKYYEIGKKFNIANVFIYHDNLVVYGNLSSGKNSSGYILILDNNGNLKKNISINPFKSTEILNVKIFDDTLVIVGKKNEGLDNALFIKLMN